MWEGRAVIFEFNTALNKDQMVYVLGKNAQMNIQRIHKYVYSIMVNTTDPGIKAKSNAELLYLRLYTWEFLNCHSLHSMN